MKPFSEIRSLFVRAAHTSANAHAFESSSAPKWKARFVGAVAVVLAIATAGVGGPSPVRADKPAARQPDAATVARARAAFLKYMSSHRPVVRSSMAPLVPSGGASSFPSINWSGFADSESGSKTISSISGDWVIPYVQCPTGLYQNQDAFISQWVGIDGLTDETVEQLGTATQCFEGVTYYYVWVEMFPAGTIEEGTVACINNNVDCPKPGDRISASITVTAGGNYTLSLTDFTRPQESFSVTAACSPSVCADTSAEWIVERPAFEIPFGFQILPLVDYFQTGFSNGKVTSGGSTTYIEGFKDGPVYDVSMLDDTESYYLDCVGQRGFGFPRLLETTNPNACPTVSTVKGSFGVYWDSSF